MLDFLLPKDGPVIEGREDEEVVFAKNQPEYIPLRALVSEGGAVMSRWTLTREKRYAIHQGADIFLTLYTFGNPLQPITMAIGDGNQEDRGLM